jgi:ketosteroid isomerase-like protein
MAVTVHVTLRGVSKEQYDAVRQLAGWLEQPPAGGLSHITWWEGDVCHNVDAWESEEAFAAFGEQRLGPAMASAGVDAALETAIYPAHEVFTPRSTIVAPTAAPTISLTSNVDIVRRGYTAFAAGDIPAVLGLFGPDIKWYTPDTVRFGGAYSGPAAVGEFFSKLPENFSELVVTPESYIDRGDTVTVMGTHHGRSATGVPFDIPWVHIWTLSGGKATSFTEYFDTMKMNAALGLVAQTTAASVGGDR